MICIKGRIGSQNTRVFRELSPYSNRGKRIGTHISVYEERERYIIEYTCVINKEKRRKVLLRHKACFFLRI
jgi:hypothetical protein